MAQGLFLSVKSLQRLLVTTFLSLSVGLLRYLYTEQVLLLLREVPEMYADRRFYDWPIFKLQQSQFFYDKKKETKWDRYICIFQYFKRNAHYNAVALTLTKHGSSLENRLDSM